MLLTYAGMRVDVRLGLGMIRENGTAQTAIVLSLASQLQSKHLHHSIFRWSAGIVKPLVFVINQQSGWST